MDWFENSNVYQSHEMKSNCGGNLIEILNLPIEVPHIQALHNQLNVFIW